MSDWQYCMEGGRIIVSTRPWERYDQEAVWINQNSDLCLGIKTSPKDVKHWDGKIYKTKYAVGLVRSIDTFGYGIFSADIKLPKGRNLWPAFWLVGNGPWPKSGEIDIMEAWSSSRGRYYRFPLSWETTTDVHYELDNKHKHIGSKGVSMLKQTKNPTDNFINYKIEWRPNKITFFVNGKVVREVGWEICRNFLGSQMDVIFNMATSSEDFTCESPMVIRNFKYEAL